MSWWRGIFLSWWMWIVENSGWRYAWCQIWFNFWGPRTSFIQRFTSVDGELSTDSGWEGYCLVQRIEPNRLSYGGRNIRLIVRGGYPVGGASIRRVSISRADPAGPPYSSAEDLKVLSDYSPFGVNFQDNVCFCDTYTLSADEPLLIAVDFMAEGTSTVAYDATVPPEEATAYYKLGEEAANQRRSDFTPYPGVALIEIVDVQAV